MLPRSTLLHLLQSLDSAWQAGLVRWPGSGAGAVTLGVRDVIEEKKRLLLDDEGVAGEARRLERLCAAAAAALHAELRSVWRSWQCQEALVAGSVPAAAAEAGSAGVEGAEAGGEHEAQAGAAAGTSAAEAAGRLQQQLDRLLEVAAGLKACERQSTAFLRRYATAVLLLLRQQLPLPAWPLATSRTAAQLLLQLQLLHEHSAAARGAVEFTHVSKSGGTSLCKLASESHCASQSFQISRNCMVSEFVDDPTWSLARNVTLQHGQEFSTEDFSPFCAYQCPQHVTKPRHGCQFRRQLLTTKAWNFYANEQPVHDAPVGGDEEDGKPASQTADAASASSSTLNATRTTRRSTLQSESTTSTTTSSAAPGAQLCGEFVNVLSLREPLAHMNSLVQELQLAYQRHVTRHKRKLSQYHIPWSYNYVADIAPAVMDSYSMRMLLGRQYMCGELLKRKLGPAELAAAKAMVVQYDVVLVTGMEELNTPALQQGLGWQGATLEGIKMRKAR